MSRWSHEDTHPNDPAPALWTTWRDRRSAVSVLLGLSASDLKAVVGE